MQRYRKFGYGQFSRYAVNPTNRIPRHAAQRNILDNSRLCLEKHRSSRSRVSTTKRGTTLAAAAFAHIQTALAMLRYLPLHIKRFIYRMLGFQYSEQRDSDAKERALVSKISRVGASNRCRGEHNPRRKIIPYHSQPANSAIGIAKFFVFLLSFSYLFAAISASETAAVVAVSLPNMRRRGNVQQARNNTSVSEYRRFSIFNNSSAICPSANMSVSNTSVVVDNNSTSLQENERANLRMFNFAHNSRSRRVRAINSLLLRGISREEKEQQTLERLISSCVDAVETNDTERFLRFISVKSEVIAKMWSDEMRLGISDQVSANCTLRLLIERDNPSAALRFASSEVIKDRVTNESRVVFWLDDEKPICNALIKCFENINEKTAANKLQAYCGERFPSKFRQLISVSYKPVIIAFSAGFLLKSLSLGVKLCARANLIAKLNNSTSNYTNNKWNYDKARNKFVLKLDPRSLKSGLQLQSVRIAMNQITSYYSSKGIEEIIIDNGNGKVMIGVTDANIERIKSLPREAINCMPLAGHLRKNTNKTSDNKSSLLISSSSSSSSSTETKLVTSAKKDGSHAPTTPRLAAEQWRRVIANCKDDPRVKRCMPENFIGNTCNNR